MKKKICIILLFFLLCGCGKKEVVTIAAGAKTDSSIEGIVMNIPQNWQAGNLENENYYSTPDKQVFMVKTIFSESFSGDITDPADRENFVYIASQSALNSNFTSEEVIDVGGKNAIRVTYDILNGTQIMRMVHVGVIKDNCLYSFSFLMPENANDSKEFDQVIRAIKFS